MVPLTPHRPKTSIIAGESSALGVWGTIQLLLVPSTKDPERRSDAKERRTRERMMKDVSRSMGTIAKRERMG